MLMTSIRNSGNIVLMLDGERGRWTENISSYDYLTSEAGWCKNTGVFSDVKDETFLLTDPSIARLKEVVKDKTRLVSLSIKPQLMEIAGPSLMSWNIPLESTRHNNYSATRDRRG